MTNAELKDNGSLITNTSAPGSWEHYRGLHEGETCLVIGNGPSLNKVPKGFLREYTSFGTNRIYLMPDFAPDYYVSVNPLVIGQFHEDIANLTMPKFLPERYCFDDTCLPLVSTGIQVFSQDASHHIYEGHTVTFVCLQIAYYMGFDTVLMVGVDHSFQYDGRPNEQKHMDGADPNHFHPDYFKGAEWNNPDLERSAKAYKLAHDIFEKNGKRIVNLTPGTQEQVFEKGNINDW